MTPPPKIMPIPPRRQKAVPIKLRIARIVTPTGLTILISPSLNCFAAAYCIRTLSYLNGEIYVLSKIRNLECPGFRHSPVRCASRAAGDECANAVGKVCDLRSTPARMNSMDESSRKSITGADGICDLYMEARRFQIFIVQQKRAAFLAKRDACSIQLKGAETVAAKLLPRVGLDPANFL